ncbi:MAG: hypothetical protein V3S04_02600 [Candidatus Omnitrophota bacterium]
MKRALLVLTAIAVTQLLCFDPVFASGDPMYDFYDGLSQILEREMNHPSDCVAASEIFIRQNIGKLEEAIKRSMAIGEDTLNSEMTEEELQKKTEGIIKSKGFQAMNRFMAAFQAFASKNPKAAQKITAVMDEYESSFRDEEAPL